MIKSSVISIVLLLSVAGQGLAQKKEDNGLLMGKFNNGMAYYLQANPLPKNRVEVYLVVNAGSVQEDGDQLGFAHFLEHMAFNGTVNFPKHTVVDFVESLGMSFGQHLNAYTSFDETVYTMTVPTDSPGYLHKALRIASDWAGGRILIDSLEVVAERGVVLGEWRSRYMDSTRASVFRKFRALRYGKDSRYVTRFPIGDPKLLRTANPAELKRFYDDWYRPDLMAIIVVGDFEPTGVFSTIEELFSSIKPRSEVSRERPIGEVLDVSGPVFQILVDRVPPQIEVGWRFPQYPKDIEENLTRRIVEQLIQEELQLGYARMAFSEYRPFAQASFGRIAATRESLDKGINVIAHPESLVVGMAKALEPLVEMSKVGMSDSLLQVRKDALLRRAERSVRSRGPSKYYATKYKEHFLGEPSLLIDPNMELEILKKILPNISSKAVQDAAQFWRKEENRYVNILMPEFAPVRRPTAQDINRVFDSLSKINTFVESFRHRSHHHKLRIFAEMSPHGSIAAGNIVSIDRFARSGVEVWHASNGAKVVFKQSDNSPTELIVRAYSPGGTSLLPDSLFFSPGRLVGRLISAAGTIGQLGRSDILNDGKDSSIRGFSVDLSYADESMTIIGSSKDAEHLFQQLHTQFISPTIDTSAFNIWRRYGHGAVEDAISENDRTAAMFARGHRRFRPVSEALVDLLEKEQAISVFKHRFGDASDFTFIVISALPAEAVKPLVEKYIASLPSTNRSTREKPKQSGIEPMKGVLENHRMLSYESPKANTAFIFHGLFDSTGEAYLQSNFELTTVASVVSRRLRNEMRERLGATYGVMVKPSIFRNPRYNFMVYISYDSDPGEVDSLMQVLEHQLDSLRVYGAEEDELRIVNQNLYRQWEASLLSNSYWLSLLTSFDRIGIPFDRIVERPSHRLNKETFKAAVTRFLPADAVLKQTQVPENIKEKE